MLNAGIPKETTSDDKDLPNSDIDDARLGDNDQSKIVDAIEILRLTDLSMPYVQPPQPIHAHHDDLRTLVQAIKLGVKSDGTVNSLAPKPFVDDSVEAKEIGATSCYQPTFAEVAAYSAGGALCRKIARWIGWNLIEWEGDDAGTELYDTLATSTILAIASSLSAHPGEPITEDQRNVVRKIAAIRDVPVIANHVVTLYQFAEPNQFSISGTIAIPSNNAVAQYCPDSPPLWLGLGIPPHRKLTFGRRVHRVLTTLAMADAPAAQNLTWTAAYEQTAAQVPSPDDGIRIIQQQVHEMEDIETQAVAHQLTWESVEEENLSWAFGFVLADLSVWETILVAWANGDEPDPSYKPRELKSTSAHVDALRSFAETALYVGYINATPISDLGNADKLLVNLDNDERAIDVYLRQIRIYATTRKGLCGDGLEFGEMVAKASRTDAILARTSAATLPKAKLIPAGTYSHRYLGVTQLAHTAMRFRNTIMPKKGSRPAQLFAFSFVAPGGVRVNMPWRDVRRADRGRTGSDPMTDFVLSASGIPINMPINVPVKAQTEIRSRLVSAIAVRAVLERIRPLQEETDSLDVNSEDFQVERRRLRLERGRIWLDFLRGTQADAITFVLTDDWNIDHESDTIYNQTIISLIGIRDLYALVGTVRKLERFILAYGSTMAGWEGDFVTMRQAKGTELNHTKFQEVATVWRCMRESLEASFEGDAAEYEELRRERLSGGRQAVRGLASFPALGGGFVAPDTAQVFAKNAGRLYTDIIAHQAAVPRPLNADHHFPPLIITGEEGLQPYTAFQPIFAAQLALTRVLHHIRNFDRSEGAIPEAPLALTCLADGATLPDCVEGYVSLRIEHADIARYSVNHGTYAGGAKPLKYTARALGGGTGADSDSDSSVVVPEPEEDEPGQVQA